MDTNTSIYNDEIDLTEIFKIIWKGKFFIISFVLIGILLGFLYIKVQNPVYESELKIEIEDIPPFYSDKTGKIKSASDFKNYVLSKRHFDNWTSTLKKNSLAFDNISETIIIDGTELTGKGNNLLVEMSQEPDEINFIIKTNNFSILNDFYNYNHYINKLLEKEYILRAKKELKIISSKLKDFPLSARYIVDQTLPNERFITNIEMGKNIFNIQRPTVPVKVSPRSLLVYGISSILGGIIGLIIVFGRIYIGQNKNVVS